MRASRPGSSSLGRAASRFGVPGAAVSDADPPAHAPVAAFILGRPTDDPRELNRLRADGVALPARIASYGDGPADPRLQVREVLAELERRDLAPVLLPLLIAVGPKANRASADLR
jgi:hypothetical protein